MSDIPFLQILEDNKLRAVCLKIKQTLKMKSAEVKVLTILSYYFILAVIVLTNTTIRVIDMPQFLPTSSPTLLVNPFRMVSVKGHLRTSELK